MVGDLAHTIYANMLSADSLTRFDPSRVSSFRSFLYNIVCNQCYTHMRYLKRNGVELNVTDSGVDDEETQTAHVAAIEATQQTKIETSELLQSIEQYVSRCARLNRHKRDRSLRTVYAATFDGDSLESIAGQVGVTIGTVRNYIAHLARGAQAEQTGNAAQYAGESSYRPDARRELSTKAIADLVRSHSDCSFVLVDSDGGRTYPQFVVARRGWHFVTFGDSPSVDLARLTANTRGFKLHHAGGETVVMVRRWEKVENEVRLYESAKSEDAPNVS
jgi:RNA polymerase sigma factor (sigma-70 family)